MEKSIKDCECKNWCHDGMHWAEELLANHHYRCPKFETAFMKESMRLIREFVAGVDMIKTQTGEIPECLCSPYARALLIDEFVPRAKEL